VKFVTVTRTSLLTFHGFSHHYRANSMIVFRHTWENRSVTFR